MGAASKFIVPILAAIFAVLVATFMKSVIVTSPLLLDSSSSSGPVILTSKRTMNIDGLAFPTDIKIAGSMQSLIGGGTRSKWGFRVYAVGIYGDTKLIKSLKKKYYYNTGKKYNEENNIILDADASSRLAYEFSHSEQALTLLLRFHRQVPASDMAEALGEALVDKIGKDKSNTFTSFILGIVGQRDGGMLKKGTDLYITCKGGKLRVSLGEGKSADKINMKGLCPAVFRVYLGEKPVSPQAKEGFEKGFAAFV
jgi:hypothetical protein